MTSHSKSVDRAALAQLIRQDFANPEDFPRVDPADAQRVHYVHFLLDNSGSMDSRREPTCDALEKAVKALIEGERKLYGGTHGNVTLRVSINRLNGGWIARDASVYDIPVFRPESYEIMGSTPLVRETLATLQDLTSKVAERRDQGLKARGHLIWISDGGADPDDIGDVARLETLKLMIESLLNPVTPTGGKATQLFDFFAVPIGDSARGFYREIGLREEDIFDVPDSMGSRFEDAMMRSSLKILAEAGALPAELQFASSSETAADEDLNGDDILRIMQENRTKLQISSLRTP